MTERSQMVQLFTEATLYALAREEVVGRRNKRLLEPQRISWERFRGRLGSAALASLLLEDGAVTHPAAFDAAALLGGPEPLSALSDSQVEALLAGLTETSVAGAGADYLQVEDPSLEHVRQRLPSPDYVLGLSPDKGGRFSKEALRPWFPSSTTEIVLV